MHILGSTFYEAAVYCTPLLLKLWMTAKEAHHYCNRWCMHFETYIAVVKFKFANTSINVHFVFSSALDATITGFLSHNWFC